MDRWTRIVAAVMAAAFVANGAVMLAAPLGWYDAVPGVPATGPFNAHFVRDIGAVYLMGAASLAWFAWRPRQGWPALAATALWLVLHALVHIYDAACGSSFAADLRRDLVGVYLFAAIPLALVVLRRPQGA